MKIKNAFLLLVLFFALVAFVRAAPVNVTAFGAVGDNSTDNLVPIQNAINSLGSTGGTVYFPPGLYNVSDTIYVPSNIRLQGTGSTILNGTQIRLFPTHKTLFVIQNGASNVVFKDLYLMSIGDISVWPRSSSSDVALIRTEDTAGISFEAGEQETSDIVIENVRISQFTYGLKVPGDRYDTSVTDVKIRGYASDGNEYSLYTDTPGADNWDVQNMNVYPMYDKQNGIFLERSGDMRFLQLSCASAGASVQSGICAKLWGNGDLYFRQMHIEGPRVGICAGGSCDPNTVVVSEEVIEENSSRITIESSATSGEFHRATDLVSINNRFWFDYPTTPTIPVYKFYGTGVYSSLRSCGDVWMGWGPTHTTLTTVSIPSGVFPGLPNPAPSYASCLQSDLTTVPVFNTGYEPDNERLSAAEINVTTYGAVANDGNDDTTAFANAILAGASNYKRVYVPPGTFDIDSTLDLSEGQTILGEAGSIINLTSENTSLFRIKNGNGYALHGVTLRNLLLTADSDTGTIGINFENYSNAGVGAASDFQVQNVDAQGFEIGITASPIGAVWTNPHPMFDSVSVKDGDFSGNKTAILVQSENASNWNLEDIRVTVPDDQEGVRIKGAGVSIRNLSCEGTGDGKSCLTIQRSGVVPVDNLSATGVVNALLVPWDSGYAQFPVTVRNSNLIEGAYFQGRIYLNSVNNTYPATIISLLTKQVKFGAYLEGDPSNYFYGGQSDIFTCDDIFVDSSSSQTTWAYSGTLIKPETYCN